MTLMYWMHSKKKGEVIFRDGQNLLVVCAGVPPPVFRTMHFGVKPGHIVYMRDGEYILEDPGYINFFRPESTSKARLNTLRGQRLLGRGRLHVRVKDYRIRVVVWTLFPFHVRIVRSDVNMTSVSIRDWYLWRRTVDWTGRIRSRKAWFTQRAEV